MCVDELIEFLKLLGKRLDEAGFKYMITGSMAMAVYAVPRMTRDIDLVIEISLADTERLIELFASDCYIEENAVRDAIKQRGMFNIIHNDWILKADFTLTL